MIELRLLVILVLVAPLSVLTPLGQPGVGAGGSMITANQADEIELPGSWAEEVRSAVAIAVTAEARSTGAVEIGPFTVTTTADTVVPADGLLSLREAVSAASSKPGDDEIVLSTGEMYQLTRCDGPDQEDANAAGDLDHGDETGALTISGHGSTVEQTCVGDDT